MPKIMRFLPFLILLALVSACNNYDFTNTFSYLPKNPQAGKAVTILYNNQSTNLSEAESIKVTAYLYDVDVNNVIEMQMENSSGGWVSELQLPADISGLLLKFSADEKTDNNDGAGYAIKLTNSKGEILPKSIGGIAAAYAGWGYYGGFDRNREKTIEILEDLFVSNPEVKSDFLDTYLGAVKRNEPDAFNEKVKAELESLQGKENLNASELYILSKYNKILGNEEESEKFGSELLEKYSDSRESQEELVSQISDEENVKQQIEKLAKFEKQFPESNLLTDAYDNVVFGLLGQNKFDELNELLKNNPNAPSLYDFHYVVQGMIDKNYDNESALLIARLGQERSIREIEVEPSKKPDYLLENEWIEEQKYGASLNLFTYGSLLSSTGQPQMAITHLEQAVDYSKNEKSMTNISNEYLKCLIASGEMEKATKAAEEFISNGRADAETKETLKTLYVNKNNSEDGFEEYLTKFEEMAFGELLTQLKKELINEPAPDFELTDIKGNSVRLSDLKGKNIIVDFWATWCGPCRKSFPGMKIAVEKYENDPNVEFLFVNTWERVEDKVKNASDFMRKNKYPFHVLMDVENKVVADYKVAGIPTKFVIDKNQNIRFKSVGITGSPQHIADEIDVMLNLIK